MAIQTRGDSKWSNSLGEQYTKTATRLSHKHHQTRGCPAFIPQQRQDILWHQLSISHSFLEPDM
jgi:hypothetical protein